MKISNGMCITIQSYKHNQQLHRAWNKTMIVERNNHLLVTAHKKACVIEDNGRRWFTKEPAICFFYEDHWFNVIAMLKKEGTYYYCNISSPYLIDVDGIKYIDYDLDVKVYPDGSVHILDQNEFEYHQKLMAYPESLIQIVKNELAYLLKCIEQKKDPFNKEAIQKYYTKYLAMSKPLKKL